MPPAFSALSPASMVRAADPAALQHLATVLRRRMPLRCWFRRGSLRRAITSVPVFLATLTGERVLAQEVCHQFVYLLNGDAIIPRGWRSQMGGHLFGRRTGGSCCSRGLEPAPRSRLLIQPEQSHLHHFVPLRQG